MIVWGFIGVLTVSTLVLAVVLGLVYRKYKRTDSKIKFMLNALDNNDYSFSFRTTNHSTNETRVNESLNIISDMLKKARLEAIEREKFYELITNSVRTGILVVDNDGHILRTNDSALRLIGLEVLTHVEQIQRVSPELKGKIYNIKSGEKQQATLQDERGATQLQLQAAETVLKGKHVRIISLNDINAELNQNELDSWTKLIRVLTHEIMNTVAPITSLSETLLAKTKRDGNEEVYNGLEVIQKTSRELTSFVENYRRLTHLPTPVPSLFYVKPFAERSRQIALQMVGNHPISIHIDVQPADLILYADENLVAHVVNNLLKNAVQALLQNLSSGETPNETMPTQVASVLTTPTETLSAEGASVMPTPTETLPTEGASVLPTPTETLPAEGASVMLTPVKTQPTAGGNVWLKAWANADETITIDIIDDGPMIGDDVAKHIFVPFFTTKKNGSGIGLSVSRQIMQLSGGSLTLKTDHKQGLTIFEMVFP